MFNRPRKVIEVFNIFINLRIIDRVDLMKNKYSSVFKMINMLAILMEKSRLQGKPQENVQ